MIQRILEELKGNKKHAMILGVVVSLAVIALYINFLLIPQTIWLGGLLHRANDLKSDLSKIKEDVAKTDILKKALESNKEKIERYERTLPAEREIPAFLESLSNMARDSDVKILAITPVISREYKAPKDQAYQEIPILINARSGYHELGLFLSRMEGSDRFMKVVDISVRSGKGGSKRHDIELLVVTYTLAPRNQ